MKIVIDIPEEFIDEWERDRFSNSLFRLGIGADHEEWDLWDLCEMLISAFKEAKEVYEWG